MRPLEILLVERPEADSSLVARALGEAEIACRLTIARDREEALSRLRANDGSPPDLVFLDLDLPGDDGFALLEVLKGDPNLRRVPVVALTGSGDERAVARAYELFANCCLARPLDAEALGRVLRSFEDFWVSTARLPSRQP